MPALPPDLIAGLESLLGERLTRNATIRERHGQGESWHPPMPPEAVAFARSTAEVSAIVALCAKHRVPVIAFGAGTSIEGQVVAEEGGLCLDLTQMDAILAVRPDDMDVTVQPGVTRKRLNDTLRDQGLFFPVDPGADATLGGMAATRASGTNAVRYGTMRDAVLSLEVVLADGRVIRTARRARKSAAGYDLTRLFIGSEGTLGIITELTLRLWGIPEAISAAVVAFPSVAAAVDAVIATIQAGVPVARIELLDEAMLDAVNRYAKLDYPVAPTLFLEFHGSAKGVAEQAELVGALAAERGSGPFRWTTKTEERNKLWQARHDGYYALLARYPGRKGFTTDVCVPISRLAESIAETRADLARMSMPTSILGHVGDGNYHTVFMIEPGNAAELESVKRFAERQVDRALAMDGTSTGEHGVGIGKIAAVEREFGHGVAVMRAIKMALDPANLLNPGKILAKRPA
ncbi:MAG: FAD-binding protein [Rhodospirillales bacterium]|nr:FAD-binding protein [Rhodospirillales bacterium]